MKSLFKIRLLYCIVIVLSTLLLFGCSNFKVPNKNFNGNIILETYGQNQKGDFFKIFDGNQIKLLLSENTGNISSPRFTNDGKQIVFEKSGQGSIYLYTYDIALKKEKKISKEGFNTLKFDLVDNHRALVIEIFEGENKNKFKYFLSLYDFDTDERKVIPISENNRSFAMVDIAVSPDGKFALIPYRPGHDFEGPWKKQLKYDFEKDTVEVIDFGELMLEVEFFEDPNYIAFIGDKLFWYYPFVRGDVVWLMNLKTGKKELITKTDGGGKENLKVTPDGKHFLYVDTYDSNIAQKPVWKVVDIRTKTIRPFLETYGLKGKVDNIRDMDFL